MEQPEPDDKNWTWVLERRCPQCDFDAPTIDRDELGAMIRANAAAWRAVLSRGDLVSVRPWTAPGAAVIWSALEYGAHVQDVYRLFGERIKAMLSTDEPTFDDWNQDEAAIEGRYHELDAGIVSYGLAVSAGELADMIDRVSGDQWARLGRRSDGDSFTVESLATYLLHDVSHHLWDAEQGYQAIRDAL